MDKNYSCPRVLIPIVYNMPIKLKISVQQGSLGKDLGGRHYTTCLCTKSLRHHGSLIGRKGIIYICSCPAQQNVMEVKNLNDYQSSLR